MITRTPEVAAKNGALRVELGGQPAAEYYQSLWARLQGPAQRLDAPQTVGVTSCSGREGVSTVAANLAMVAAAQPKHRVLLVEANFRRPVLARWLHADSGPGLADLLAGHCDLQTALHPTAVAELTLLPAGERGAAIAPRLDLSLLPPLLNEMKESFDLVVFDLPPATATSLALPISGVLDGVVLVVEAEKVPWEMARRTRSLLMQSHATILGAVLNKRRERWPTGGTP